MKRLFLIFTSSAIAIAFGACNKHSWDEEINGQIPTKKIFEPHGDHGHGDDHEGGAEGEGHGKAHGDEGTADAAHP
ncbi:MAG: hypothetical protein ACR2RV_08650 [Verrucomicrobiales bacterium]